jgi:hypothetical protein
MGVLASSLGIFEAIAIGGVLSLLTGVGALFWYRRLKANVSTIDRAVPAEMVLQSTDPSTSAAFSPPNPNEVLSTRR